MKTSPPKKIALLGATGSIGTNALKVMQAQPDHYQVSYLTAGRNAGLLAQQAQFYQPRAIAIADPEKYRSLRKAVGSGIEILAGKDGIVEIASRDDYDLALNAIVGAAGLEPTYAALQAGKSIALSNKESLVMAGEIIMDLAHKMGVDILPVDSEHSAIWQCLLGEDSRSVKRLILTGSGGPFRTASGTDLAQATARDALQHPTWQMGKKITIDSATMMNKGLEVIEAHWLFDIPAEQINIVIHPQSIIHSMVEFVDGSIKAQLGLPDMKLPIQFALSYPDRAAIAWETTDLAEIGSLTFEPPDMQKFAALPLAYAALQTGGTAPAILNVANESAVYAFLEDKIAFPDIPRLVEKALTALPIVHHPTMDDILANIPATQEFIAGQLKS